MPTEPLTAQAASVTTVSIDVRVVRVGTKQMTLSVFRQLREASIIDPQTMRLNGTPWGWVNYHPNDGHCATTYGPHLHVIWQAGGNLWADTVPTRARSGRSGCGVYASGVIKEREQALFNAASIWHLLRQEERLPAPDTWECKDSRLHFTAPDHQGRSHQEAMPLTRQMHLAPGCPVRRHAERYFGEEIPPEMTASQYYSHAFIPAAHRLYTEEARWVAVAEALHAVGQLFIAV